MQDDHATDGAGIVVASPLGLARLAGDVESYIRSTRSEATRAAYSSDLRTFFDWMSCPECPAPDRLPRPLTVEEYAALIKSTGPVSAKAVAM